MLFHSIQGAGGYTAPAASINLSYLTSSYQDTALTTYTFSSLSLGSADSTRKIIVFISARNITARTVSSVTVAGVSATAVAGNVNSQDLVSSWIASVPTGTTGDVVVTMSGAATRCGVNIYRLVNSTGLSASALPVASTNYNITTPSGNSVVAAMTADTGSGHSTNIVWTGLTEDVDSNWSTNIQTSTASGSFSTSGSKTISINVSAERGIVLCYQ